MHERVSSEERAGRKRFWRGKEKSTAGGRRVQAGERKAGMQESRVIKVLDGRERGSWRTATEAACFSRLFLLRTDTRRHSGGERLA